ncbi:MAG: mechanosensitive ion channel [Lutibacter sp.]|nr:mechanosensitive ion channel [Lutibacter sp.]
MKTIKEFLELELLSIGKFTIMVHSIVVVIAIFLLTKVLLWLISKALARETKLDNLDEGNSYAIFQIIRYIIWIVSFGFILQAVGIKVTVLIAGSAALLVGVGLGLQQTFNDIISGIILLSERSIKINDILEIDGDILKIQEIGLRTSKGLSRDEISIIIPNSLITTNKVINWSHQSKKTRFKINIGVAYESDLDLVVKVLKESAWEHPEVSEKELIAVRFLDFGPSSLQFQVIFFSENIFRIERVKSDIRMVINRKFNEHKISIPFPQMDVYVKSNLK